ncbi:GlpM family protein [Uliginosibacterium flavum]|uniref:GlpM family protein n=1 Tax=Uliginosibacterium flavum TaxID=1396831 RepID=A0ABV2TKN2_9RHOO
MDAATLIKSSLGFVLVLIIQLAARSKLYYLSALIPLFPSLAMFSYYFVGSSQSVERLQETIAFGMLSLITYLCFLIALFISVRYLRIAPALLLASAVWFGVAFVEIRAWPYLKPLLGFNAT